jgi:DNA-directed RNA polymerase subunit E'/Rpb7
MCSEVAALIYIAFHDREVLLMHFRDNSRIFMFVLSVVEDEVAIPANRLQSGKHISEVRAILEAKYIDRVFPSLGLVVGVYDILSIKDAFVFPGDLKDSHGEAAGTVIFRLLVFCASAGEVILGRVIRSTTTGVCLSVSGLVEIEVPSRLLQQPSVFDERSRTWVWQFQGPDGKKTNLFYDIGEEVACVVSAFYAGDSSNRMLIIASMNQTGTGPLKWWI